MSDDESVEEEEVEEDSSGDDTPPPATTEAATPTTKTPTAAPAKKQPAKGGAAKPAAKKSKPKATGMKSQEDVNTWVLNYLNKQNRPFSSINLVDLSGGNLKKVAVERALATLAEEQKISCKDLKKQKIYLARQDQFDAPSEEELGKLDQSIKDITAELTEMEKENHTLGNRVRKLVSELPDGELDAEIKRLEQTTSTKEGKLKKLQSGVALLDEKEKAALQKAYEDCRGQWRKRKRWAREMVDAVCGDAKRPKDLMEEIGIETDEDMGVSLESTEVVFKKARR